VKNGAILGNLYVEGNGDPTLGSSRWQQTKDSSVLKTILLMLQKKGIKKINGDIWIHDMKFGINPIPDGWIWQDIGNYYGAGSWGLSWKENQYDLVLSPGTSKQDLTHVKETRPAMTEYQLGNFIRTGEKGSGDHGYIYFSPYSKLGFATGTIPLGEDGFTISGSMPQPARQFGSSLRQYLGDNGIRFNNKVKLYSDSLFQDKPIRRMMFEIDSVVSPPLDSIIYWFNKKSINLYGEALVKTFALRQDFTGSTDKGVKIVREFWKQKGIDEDELNMRDGSGLSPLNRVTTHAQVEILKYAKSKSWFPLFYNALPEYNKMKMKSGTISDVKAFCGYQQAANGNEYIFSFIVNNYNGSASGLVNKMYTVLDLLK